MEQPEFRVLEFVQEIRKRHGESAGKPNQYIKYCTRVIRQLRKRLPLQTITKPIAPKKKRQVTHRRRQVTKKRPTSITLRYHAESSTPCTVGLLKYYVLLTERCRARSLQMQRIMLMSNSTFKRREFVKARYSVAIRTLERLQVDDVSSPTLLQWTAYHQQLQAERAVLCRQWEKALSHSEEALYLLRHVSGCSSEDLLSLQKTCKIKLGSKSADILQQARTFRAEWLQTQIKSACLPSEEALEVDSLAIHWSDRDICVTTDESTIRACYSPLQEAAGILQMLADNKIKPDIDPTTDALLEASLTVEKIGNDEFCSLLQWTRAAVIVAHDMSLLFTLLDTHMEKQVSRIACLSIARRGLMKAKENNDFSFMDACIAHPRLDRGLPVAEHALACLVDVKSRQTLQLKQTLANVRVLLMANILVASMEFPQAYVMAKLAFERQTFLKEFCVPESTSEVIATCMESLYTVSSRLDEAVTLYAAKMQAAVGLIVIPQDDSHTEIDLSIPPPFKRMSKSWVRWVYPKPIVFDLVDPFLNSPEAMERDLMMPLIDGQKKNSSFMARIKGLITGF